MEAFWKFWSDQKNYSRFLDEFFSSRGLAYREDLTAHEFHIFPVPGKLLSEDLEPPKYHSSAASMIFPPSTRSIGLTTCEVDGVRRLAALIESIQIDPETLKRPGALLPSDRITRLPPFGTREASHLITHVETRYPRIEDGAVVDLRPINWLMTLYQLQIFLLQPFVGNMRKVNRGKTRAKQTPQPPQEIVQVLMRDTMPEIIPPYRIAAFHPVTGRKLEFEVDVRAHERHCASGVVVQVKAHKRGPIGNSREKVIKVIR